MMVEALESLYDRLWVTDLKNEEVLIEKDSMRDVVAREKNYLFMKLLSNGYHNQEALNATMSKVWRPSKAISFHDMGMGLVMVDFENLADKLRVIRDGSWHFNKALLLIKYFVGEQQVKNIQMKDVAFWIRIHGLLFMARNETIGHEVGKSLGWVEEVDLESGEVEWGEFMRIRVVVKVTKPLLC